MSISKILNSLEKSWERDDILLNIKKGLGTDEIVNLNKNKVKSKNNSKNIEDKVKINYFANRLIRKS